MTLEIHHFLYRLCYKGLTVCFAWIPDYAGVDRNKDADTLVKQSPKSKSVNMEVPISKAEGKKIKD